MSTVAVIGLGAMGSRIARRLIDAGQDVIVWNRTPAKAAGFPRVAATAAEAAREAEVTITMLANPQALREVTAEIEPNVLIEMSTVGPATVHELAARIPRLLDAPVLGSRSEAERGTLHVFVGAGAEPCILLMIGARGPGIAYHYPVCEAAIRHGAGVDAETDSPDEAYANAAPLVTERPSNWDELPWSERN